MPPIRRPGNFAAGKNRAAPGANSGPASGGAGEVHSYNHIKWYNFLRDRSGTVHITARCGNRSAVENSQELENLPKIKVMVYKEQCEVQMWSRGGPHIGSIEGLYSSMKDCGFYDGVGAIPIVEMKLVYVGKDKAKATFIKAMDMRN